MHKIASRKFFFAAAVVWGAIAIFLSGAANASFSDAVEKLADQAARDTMYHYHVSGVFSTVVTLVAFIVLSFFAMKSIKSEGLKSAIKMLILFDLISVVSGSGSVLCLGWFKEIFDEMSGKFYDSRDMNADIMGVFSQAVWALILLVPAHGALFLLGDSLRKKLVAVFTPEKSRRHAERVFEVDSEINRNSERLKEQHKEIDRLEREIRKLKSIYNNLSEAEKASDKGRRVKEEIAGREEKLLPLHEKISILENENSCLKQELLKLSQVLKSDSESLSLAGEVDGVLAVCSYQSGKLNELKGRSAMNIMSAESIDSSVREQISAGNFALQESAEKPVEKEAGTLDPSEKKLLTEEIEKLKKERAVFAEKFKDQEQLISGLKNTAEKAGKESAAPKVDESRLNELSEKINKLKKKVLIIDEDENFCNLAEESLTQSGLMEVTSFHSAVEAVNYLKESKAIPDLIAIEAMMPKVSGIDFCLALQKNSKTRKVSIIFFSTMAPDAMPELNDIDYDAYLMKPVPVDKLKEEIFSSLRLLLS
ncbi:MAG: response regulator [Planctomycetota bacterium]|jgi:CheY-like chemotaxis protein